MTDLKPLRPFIKKANQSPDAMLRYQASQLAPDEDMADVENDIPDPDIEGQDKDLAIEDHLMNACMPSINIPTDDNDQFGSIKPKANQSTWDQYRGTSTSSIKSAWEKIASAYVGDKKIKSFSNDTKKDIERFYPNRREAKVIQYGMVVSELLDKVDQHNFAQAEEHIAKDCKGKDKQDLKDEFFKKAKDKYILILNDRVLDGHHFISKAKYLGITNSLNVIDLTPIRFEV